VQRKDALTQKSQWSNWTVLAMLVLCFFVLIQFRPFESRDPAEQAGVGEKLPQLRLRPLDGNDKTVALSDMAGRVVLLNFWGTWCPPCREELPHIAALYREFRSRPAFELLAVSCEEDGTENLASLRQATEGFLKQQRIDVPVYTDRGGVTRAAVRQVVGFAGYPTTLVLDRQGCVRGVWSGYRPGMEDQMRELVARLLEES